MVVPDLDKIFSYKYPSPSELGSSSRLKHYVYCMSIVILILLITIIITATNSSGYISVFDHNSELDSQANQHQIELSGTYQLNQYDNNFGHYLRSLDIPQMVIGLIQASKEMITVSEPSANNPNWTLTMRTGTLQKFREIEVGFINGSF